LEPAKGLLLELFFLYLHTFSLLLDQLVDLLLLGFGGGEHLISVLQVIEL
jgi:hypothetical protein